MSADRLAIVAICDVLAPGCAVPLIIDLKHGKVSHEAVGGGAVTVLLAWIEEDAVAWVDDLYWAASPLASANALGNVDRLAIGVGVPGGVGARRCGRPAVWAPGGVGARRCGRPA
jgi:hypothetical protein